MQPCCSEEEFNKHINIEKRYKELVSIEMAFFKQQKRPLINQKLLKLEIWNSHRLRKECH